MTAKSNVSLRLACRMRGMSRSCANERALSRMSRSSSVSSESSSSGSSQAKWPPVRVTEATSMGAGVFGSATLDIEMRLEFSSDKSDPLEHDRHALTHADAQGNQRVTPARALQLARGRERDARTRASERMAQRDGAAVRIDPAVL